MVGTLKRVPDLSLPGNLCVETASSWTPASVVGWVDRSRGKLSSWDRFSEILTDVSFLDLGFSSCGETAVIGLR